MSDNRISAKNLVRFAHSLAMMRNGPDGKLDEGQLIRLCMTFAPIISQYHELHAEDRLVTVLASLGKELSLVTQSNGEMFALDMISMILAALGYKHPIGVDYSESEGQLVSALSGSDVLTVATLIAQLYGLNVPRRWGKRLRSSCSSVGRLIPAFVLLFRKICWSIQGRKFCRIAASKSELERTHELLDRVRRGAPDLNDVLSMVQAWVEQHPFMFLDAKRLATDLYPVAAFDIADAISTLVKAGAVKKGIGHRAPDDELLKRYFYPNSFNRTFDADRGNTVPTYSFNV